MKTLGILGGVGPETTSKVYHSVIDSIRKNGGKYYPSIIIYNLSWPFSLENEIIVRGRNSEQMIPYLKMGAKILERAGATFAILPCNTLHKHIDEIRAAMTIPFLSIVEETKFKLHSLKINKVGILASQTTISSNLYGKALKQGGIEQVQPNQDEQNEINRIIIQLVRGKHEKLHAKKISQICASLNKREAKSILLACTDLQLIKGIKSPVPIIDTTEVLIEASVRELLKK
ncbi:MAG: hypothetical protein A3J48_01885 [Candidatus Doudnabacteria bacterium RIFCSPHIGHO2_02_FULL_46_11]|uniref:Aspartate racemase n=1 Tax=Candidatus Doudnabacteria bacterium RIFCSPHIGHO2_02_FULL_46_11 TaxID=1817832 RepID=A0A1F5PAI0_9BACT|nr:MAG: hypothetical protein A3J48_01885 [Candidatus Doudnabacteria bacterium RIFCSPHIGHO2_02_FULL_46_11]